MIPPSSTVNGFRSNEWSINCERWFSSGSRWLVFTCGRFCCTPYYPICRQSDGRYGCMLLPKCTYSFRKTRSRKGRLVIVLVGTVALKVSAVHLQPRRRLHTVIQHLAQGERSGRSNCYRLACGEPTNILSDHWLILTAYIDQESH